MNKLIQETVEEITKAYVAIANKHNPGGEWLVNWRKKRPQALPHIVCKVRQFVNKRPRLRRRYEKTLRMDLAPLEYMVKERNKAIGRYWSGQNNKAIQAKKQSDKAGKGSLNPVVQKFLEP